MLTSHAYPRAPPPSCCAVSSAFAPSREQSATLAPAAVNAWQISRPMPRVPPVTSATFPGSSIFTMSRCFHELRHLVRRPQADHVRAGDDPLQETGEHRARADLDETSAVTTNARRLLHALHPANRGCQLIRQQPARATRFFNGFGRGVPDHRERG